MGRVEPLMLTPSGKGGWMVQVIIWRFQTGSPSWELAEECGPW